MFTKLAQFSIDVASHSSNMNGRRRPLPRMRTLGLFCVSLFICAIMFIAVPTLLQFLDDVGYGLRPGDVLRRVSRKSHVRTHGLPFRDSWGAYSPYQPQAQYSVPAGCQVKMANVIQRHGARYPTEGATERIQKGIASMQAVPAWSEPLFEFIPAYRYHMGINDQVPFGARQSFDSGVEAARRYEKLGRPFVRASDSERVISSATNWTAGYVHIAEGSLPDILIVDEKQNTTLDDSMCPFAAGAEAQKSAWASSIAQATINRLRTAALPPSSLMMDPDDLLNLMSLCPFETLGSSKFDTPERHEHTSPWCGLWTKEDIQKFEYWMDLDKYYGTGYGNALGPVQGIGYIAELLARLTRTPVAKWDANGRTSVNHTLDDDARTFPLDHSLYVDFSHDNQIIPIISALGILQPEQPLNTTKMDTTRSWVVSSIVPFSGRLVIELLECGGDAGRAQQVRAIINDAVMQLPKPCRNNPRDGLCDLDDFIKSQGFAVGGAQKEWIQCRTGDA
ncbi:phytase [Auriculariales sp. MPI-PUGE-AT-0066]|nr:phytase [Auriculariales sp. MPI-PUGE-AT-0066]